MVKVTIECNGVEKELSFDGLFATGIINKKVTVINVCNGEMNKMIILDGLVKLVKTTIKSISDHDGDVFPPKVGEKMMFHMFLELLELEIREGEKHHE